MWKPLLKRIHYTDFKVFECTKQKWVHFISFNNNVLIKQPSIFILFFNFLIFQNIPVITSKQNVSFIYISRNNNSKNILFIFLKRYTFFLLSIFLFIVIRFVRNKVTEMRYFIKYFKIIFWWLFNKGNRHYYGFLRKPISARCSLIFKSL